MLALVSFILIFLSARFAVLRMDINGLHGIVSAIVAGGAAFIVWRIVPVTDRLNRRLLFSVGAVALLSIATVFNIFGSGWPLPAGDPIAVPVLANIMLTDALPMEVYEPGTSAYSYPPGQPILLATAGALLDPINRLFLLKVLIYLAVALTPATWAWMHARLFPTGTRTLVVVLAAYIVFFGLERTLGFAIPFAGKNAVLFGIFLAPLVMVLCALVPVSTLGTIIGGLALFGLTLINYTLLHLMCALLGALAFVGVLTGTVPWRKAAQFAGMGLIAAVLMLGLLHEALSDPRAGGFAFNLPGGLISILDTLLARNSFMIIYADADFGILGFPYRGPVLIVCTAFSIIVAQTLNRPQLRNAALVYAVALAVALIFAFSVIPAGITVDFVRWFMWAIQAAVMLTAINALWLMATRANRPALRLFFAAAGLSVCVIAVAVAILDARVFKAATASQTLPREELAAMRQMLLRETGGRDCSLIAVSTVFASSLVTVQQSRALDYAETVTPCRYLTGSWINVVPAEARSSDGFPSPSMLVSALEEGVVFLISSPERKDAYARVLDASGENIQWEAVGSISDIPVWKIHR